MDFINESGLEFTDISSEAWRRYSFADGSCFSIDKPLKLNVSSSGGHRLFDSHGISHYVPAGWNQLSWQTKDGQPHFVK